jgi:response regulator RpfG family c-di-GMP phosphodiesterase
MDVGRVASVRAELQALLEGRRADLVSALGDPTIAPADPAFVDRAARLVCRRAADGPSRERLLAETVELWTQVVTETGGASSRLLPSPPRKARTTRKSKTNVRTQVLLVDHRDEDREAIAIALRKLGHWVIAAESGEHALVLLQSSSPAVMLCDVAMPGMSGLELLEALPEPVGPDPGIAVVMITGVADADTAAACVQRGAVDYLTRPFTTYELRDAVGRALTVRGASRPRRNGGGDARRRRGSPRAGSAEAYRRRERVVVPTLDALVAALEAKSPYLAGHSARVAAFAAAVANQLSLDDDQVEGIRAAGRLHDLGMIGVREQVINKRGKLTPEEHAHVRQHVPIGVRILAPLTHLRPAVVEAVRTHHERWDGTGYPAGLSGKVIPLSGRIIGACELFDALTTERPYQDHVEPELAIERIRELTGTVVDPTVTDALAIAVERRQTLAFLR